MALKNKYPLIDKTDPWICVASRLNLSLRIISRIYRSHLKKHKVTMSQLSLLMVVGKAKSLPQNEIGKILKLERSTVTRDLQRMVAEGYFLREGKTIRPRISITDKGAKFLEKIIPDWLLATEEAKSKLEVDGEEALNLVLSKLMK